jgi:hypothetical protein
VSFPERVCNVALGIFIFAMAFERWWKDKH